MDMSRPRAYIEHPVHGLKMIYLEEREEYLKNGWHKPGENPEVEVKEKEDPVNEVLGPAGDKSFEDVKGNASDLSNWLNTKLGLKTNRRQGLKQLLGIAYDNGAEDY